MIFKADAKGHKNGNESLNEIRGSPELISNPLPNQGLKKRYSGDLSR